MSSARCLGIGTFVIAASLGLMGCPSGGIGGIDSPATCLACHNGRVAEDMRHFWLSSHRNISCGTCHIGSDAHVQSGGSGGALINPANWPVADQATVCAQCHRQEVKSYRLSAHAQSGLIGCDTCHDVHTPLETRGPFVNNILCQSCHLANWPNAAAVEAHTNHPVDALDTGASRCVGCHMPPLTRPDNPDQADDAHAHSMITIPPIESVNQADDGDVVLPNSCAGTIGCHDGTVPAAPVFDIDNAGQMTGLQAIYESWYSTKHAEAE